MCNRSEEERIQNAAVKADVLSFVRPVRDHLVLAKQIVKQNAKFARTNQKEYYDQKAREIELNVGDKVLLLLPNSKRKFIAKWQGPYILTRTVGKVNYD